MFFADKDDVVRVLICRQYNMFVMNSEQCFCNIRILRLSEWVKVVSSLIQKTFGMG
jgi:hypothetical protein